MAALTRTVRFNPEEVKRIDHFLQQNHFLDFSSLARLAICQFIENPSVTIRGISPKVTRAKVREKASRQEHEQNG